MTLSNKIEEFTEATDFDLYDDFDNSWMVEATETQETIDDFISSSKTWTESSEPETGEIAGMKFVYFPHVQTSKGEQRHYLSVVDFGDKRVALVDVDLTRY